MELVHPRVHHKIMVRDQQSEVTLPMERTAQSYQENIRCYIQDKQVVHFNRLA